MMVSFTGWRRRSRDSNGCQIHFFSFCYDKVFFEVWFFLEEGAIKVEFMLVGSREDRGGGTGEGEFGGIR